MQGLGRQRGDRQQRRPDPRVDRRRRVRRRASTNHYYLGRKLEEDPNFPVGLVWANQDDRGVHVNTSGGGVTKYSKHPAEAQRFLEWLATDGQSVLVDANHEYPANPTATPEPLITEAFGTDFLRDPLDAVRVRRAEPRRDPAHGRSRIRLSDRGDRNRPCRRSCADGGPGAPGGRRRRSSPQCSSSSRSACSPSSVLRPRADVWSQQWSTRLPGELWATAVLLRGRRHRQHGDRCRPRVAHRRRTGSPARASSGGC